MATKGLTPLASTSSAFAVVTINENAESKTPV